MGEEQLDLGLAVSRPGFGPRSIEWLLGCQGGDYMASADQSKPLGRHRAPFKLEWPRPCIRRAVASAYLQSGDSIAVPGVGPAVTRGSMGLEASRC